MNSKIKNYALLLISLLCLNSIGQNPYYYSLSKETALPDTEIYSILENDDNTFWIAANRGLYHFDGVNYTHFTHPKKKGLSVFGLKYDSKGNVWCNTISGQFFYVENNQMHLYIDLKEEFNGVLADFIFYKEQLYIFSPLKILVIDKNKKIKTIYNSKKRIGMPYSFNDSIYFACEDETFKITNEKVTLISTIKNIAFESPSFSRWFSYKNELFLFNYDQKNNKNLFFSFKNGKFSINNDFKELEKLRIISIKEYDNNLYFSTSKGIYLFKKTNEKLTFTKSIFNDIFITSIRKDKNDSFWISTINEGILIVPNLDFKYTKIVDKEDYITCIEKINNEIVYIGTFRGKLIKYNVSTQEKKLILNTIQTNKITCLKYVASSDILFISSENNFFSLNTKNDIIKESELRLINAKSLQYSISDNALLYSGYDRAFKVNLENNENTKIEIFDFKRSYSINENKKTFDIAISYADETKIYPKNNNPYSLKLNNLLVLSNQVVSSNDGLFWVSTYNNGVLGYKNSKLVTEINFKNGLASNLITKINAGENLWILTDKGIQLYEIDSKKLINYIESSNENRFIDIVELKNNLLIATSNSILQLPKENIFYKFKPKAIELKKLTVNSKIIDNKDNLEFEHYENQILIETYCNGFFPKGALVYEYQLNDSKESNWKTFKNNTILFEGLAANNYSLNIRVKNVATDDLVTATPLKFTILNPFWKRWWFITSILMLSALIGIMFYRNQIKLKEKENALAIKKINYEKELVSLQLENLKSQMNPHFIFNALNSIQEYIILNEKKLASSYLAKFAQLIRTYLNHSSQGQISIEEEIECLHSYLELEKLRFEDTLHYEINSNFINKDLKIPTMLIQPYVENAIKHGLLHKKDNRVLKINFFYNQSDEEITCIIHDNGIGRKKASELNKNKHKSFASKANFDRLELLNKYRQKNIGVTIEDLYNEMEPIGTKVILKIPVL